MSLPWNRSTRNRKTPLAAPAAFRHVSAQRPALETAAGPGQPSILLYLAGLCVTLSGLFAMNFAVEDPAFAKLTYGLAAAGYVFSYSVRAMRINLKSIQFPLFVCIALLVLANVSGSGMGWLIPADLTDIHLLGPQQPLALLVAWVAVLHSFALVNDASVLFACVPGMTLLAIISSHVFDNDVQNAFLVFVGAATFMMVHENYLRTRQERAPGRRLKRAQNLFGGQLQLTVICLLSSLLLANVVVVPIRFIGQKMGAPNPENSSADSAPRQMPMNMAVPPISEQNSLQLATGPTTESDAPIMRIKSDQGLYWRGTTFSHYTGVSFDNSLSDNDPLPLVRESVGASGMRVRQFVNPYGNMPLNSSYVYHVPVTEYALSSKEMQHSQKTLQQVMVIGSVFSSLYGAADARDVKTTLNEVQSNAAGALLANVPPNTSYEVTSQVPTSDARWLRQASSSPEEVPARIRDVYLQLPDANLDDHAKLHQLALQITQGKSNNYEKTQALRRYIAQTCKYNLQSPAAPRNRDVVAWFLLDKREGYCDSFAAALTALCRHVGIPARLASGFLTGELESDNSYLVRQKDKHAWTEVFFPHIGWVPFDATEGSTDISDHNLHTKPKRVSFGAWLMSHGFLPPTIIALLLAMLGYIIKTEVIDRLRPRRSKPDAAVQRPQTNSQIIDTYLQTVKTLARRGLPRLEHQTPDEYALLVATRTGTALPGLETELARLTALYSRARYGRDIATAAEAQQAQQTAALIRQSLQSVRPRDLAASGNAVPV